MSKIIPIALISDEKFVMPTSVMLKSLLENKNEETYYKIYVLTDNMTEQSLRYLEDMSYENFDVKVIVANNILENIKSLNKVVSNAAYLKFSIPSIFQDYDKVLYIDTDTIILKDLSELYDTDINDTYAGVVLDYCVKNYENRETLFGLKNYFNSGMILLNAKKIREDNLYESLVSWVSENHKKYRFKDQDAFNVVFNDNITIIKPQYNFLVTLHYHDKKKYLHFYNITQKDIDIDNITILHYAWRKPWTYSGMPCSKLWYSYYKKLYNKKIKLKSCFLAILYVKIRNRFGVMKYIDKIIKGRTNKI